MYQWENSFLAFTRFYLVYEQNVTKKMLFIGGGHPFTSDNRKQKQTKAYEVNYERTLRVPLLPSSRLLCCHSNSTRKRSRRGWLVWTLAEAFASTGLAPAASLSTISGVFNTLTFVLQLAPVAARWKVGHGKRPAGRRSRRRSRGFVSTFNCATVEFYIPVQVPRFFI